MDPEFWHRRWAENQIGFHEANGNPLLRKHIGVLGLAPGARVFVPLCGKARDVGWLASKGFRVVGAELSETAVGQLFDEMGRTPEISAAGPVTRHAADRVEVFFGDVFNLGAATLGPVDAVFDRAALVALPAGGLRERYAAHIARISGRARQMLLTFEYDRARMDGPPFPIDADEVAGLYGADYAIELVERVEVRGGLKGRVAASAAVWLLRGR